MGSEFQCEYFMYFPDLSLPSTSSSSSSTSSTTFSSAARLRSAPRRRHLYLGETVQFLLVLRFKEEDGGAAPSSTTTTTKAAAAARWREMVGSLSAVASVSLSEGQQQHHHHQESSRLQHESQGGCREEEEEEGDGEARTRPVFTHCKPLLTYNGAPHNMIVVTVWKEEQEKPEVREHVVNSSSVEDLFIRDMKILPNYNSSFLPMMPDGSVLVMDDVSTHYSLPSVRLNRPQLVMTASCPGAVRPRECFRVKYTLLNNLQDFLSIRLVWTPGGSSSSSGGGGRGVLPAGGMGAVVCQTPDNDLGPCPRGSTLSFSVAFQILRAGLFELSQNMKLKLHSPSNPQSVRELLGRSQSCSHQQPCRSQFIRASSVMEHGTVTPPVGSPSGRPRPPLYLAPGSAPLMPSLDKIAKRECKVLVVQPNPG
ncbi:hypothetical protein NHX12_014075 [Muraenolepis orangiensis]|uniref:Uncharacterized protein n=1 Tax=Muraenolepis orangiensis TaxID=630683 RepID=A0A9Q0I497_9TELE|nr:hypothetical protein NHX12_014075 [Muraenolepis orangiensis]